jgi:acetyltransferase-like isoleucine patch superfamily enzyme
MKASQIVKALFKVTQWPRYVVDVYIFLFYRKILERRHVFVGKNTTFWGLPIIDNSTGGKIEIGDSCLICSRSEQTALGIAHKTIIRTLTADAAIKIGSKVRMSGSTICAANNIDIGDRCVIGADVIIADTDFHSMNPSIRSSLDDGKHALNKPVKIGCDVFIGGRSIILKGVELGDRVIVGAGSVVTKSFNADVIIAGNPAVIIKNLIHNEKNSSPSNLS